MSFSGTIDAIFAYDRLRPKKQHHTAKRILQRLRNEHDFADGYTVVKDYVHGRSCEKADFVFDPLHYLALLDAVAA